MMSIPPICHKRSFASLFYQIHDKVEQSIQDIFDQNNKILREQIGRHLVYPNEVCLTNNRRLLVLKFIRLLCVRVTYKQIIEFYCPK